MNGLLLALALVIQANPAIPLSVAGDSNARLLWSRTFATEGDDWINELVPLGDGRLLAVGFLNRGEGSDWRALAALMSEDGALHTSRHYGAGGGIDSFWDAAPSADGGTVFAGFTSRIGAGGIDAFALFADGEGGVRRELSFGSAGYDRFTSMARTGRDYVFVGHSQLAGEDRRRLLAVRLRPDGTTSWQRIIEDAETISPLYVESAPGGGFIVAGGIGDDMLVMRLDDDGRELWRRAVGTVEASDTNHGLALLPNGNIIVVGYSRSWGARGNDILAVTLSPSGEVLRRAMFGSAGDDRPSLAKADGRGRVWIIGQTTGAGAGGQDALLVRLDASGRFEPGAVVIGSAAEERGTALLPLADGSAIVAGFGTGLGGGGEDAFVLRLSAPTFAEPASAFVGRDIP